MALRELRLIFTPNVTKSAGLQSFILSNYSAIKGANPSMPFLIRETRRGMINEDAAMAKIVACYDYGKEDVIQVEGKDSQQVSSIMSQLIKW